MHKSSIMFGEPPGASSSAGDIAQFVVEAAVRAPSVHNTQPWWFYGTDHEIGIHADDERRLAVADPDGREMMISCGAALFTARVAMRYIGLVPKVRVFLEPGLDTLVAKISWEEEAAPVGYERDLFAEIPRRRTHRDGFDPAPLPDEIQAALRSEASREGATLLILGDEAQRTALAGVVEAGEYATRVDSARAGLPPTGDGRPAWSAGTVAILTTEADRPQDWVAAGQALQRLLLFASTCGVSAALHSQPLEIPPLREFIKGQLCDGACPQLVVRLGFTDRAALSVRRPVDEVLF